MANHITEVAIRAKVSAYSDRYYEAAKEFGEIAKESFGGGSNKAQIRSLENIANSATRVSDILDFIKMQTGRQGRWRQKQFGKRLLEKLQDDLRRDAEDIFNKVNPEAAKQQPGEQTQPESDDRRRIHILLCREFIRHLSAHYLYTLGIQEYQHKGGNLDG